MDSNTVYERTHLNSIARHKVGARYDKETVGAIIREAKVLHVSFIDDDDMPQCIPMVGALEEDEMGDHILYLHGHPSSRIYKRLSQPNVRLVATGTILDGYVLALSPFGTGVNYRSAVLHGFTLPIGTQPVDDPEKDKAKALKWITNTAIPGRWEYAREPTATEFKETAVIRVIVDSASAKFRTGPPVDKKKDIENKELTSKVWTGVVPVRRVTGAPEPTDYSPEGPLPEHVCNL